MVKRILKSIIVFILGLVAILIFMWRMDRTYFHPYIPEMQEQIRNDVTTYKFSIPQDEEKCLALGGTWKKAGPDPIETCNIPTKDSGKSCSSSKECEGVCLAKLSTDQLRKGMSGEHIRTTGYCSEWIKVYGCRGYVYRGWANVVCAD